MSPNLADSHTVFLHPPENSLALWQRNGAKRAVVSPKSRAGAVMVEELTCGHRDRGYMWGLNKCYGHTPLQGSVGE